MRLHPSLERAPAEADQVVTILAPIVKDFLAAA